MIWLLGHDLDFEGAKISLENRCPLVDLAYKTTESQVLPIDKVKHYMGRPRYIRSHLPWELLPVDMLREDGTVRPKIIYTCRNPKDVVTSYYHYASLVHD
ncbi:luciferin sulfotransferase-like [Plodia interpunctella]|uniref:luciferin sulfotransferase-like n=1 Tax=Plodia interpunctella TaxID=58824 RepID=UPI00236887A5|nr:luciferin sulfotransferase-like [Plodia interpunctella]